MPYEDALEILKWNSKILIKPLDLSKKPQRISLTGNVYECLWNDQCLGEMSYNLAYMLYQCNHNLQFYPVQDLTSLRDEFEIDVVHFGPGMSWEWEDVVEDFYDELVSLGQNPDDFLDIKGGFETCYQAYLDRLYEEEFLR